MLRGESKEGICRCQKKNDYFVIKIFEQQRFNNCGPELVENFAYYLTGTCTSQEAAVYVHSMLLDSSLSDMGEYADKILKKKKLIVFYIVKYH